jgi:hypothetical protein
MGSPGGFRRAYQDRRFSLFGLRRWCRCMKGPVGERRWKKSAILRSAKRVLDGSQKRTPPWPRMKLTAVLRPTLYTQSMLDIAITSRGSKGELRLRAQATAVMGPISYPPSFRPATEHQLTHRRLTTSRRICCFCLPLGRSAHTKYSSSVLPMTVDPA